MTGPERAAGSRCSETMDLVAGPNRPGEAAGNSTVVVVTRNRRTSLLHTLDKLAALPERPAVVVVDNASGDGSAAAVRAVRPEVSVLQLDRNLGAVARNVGVAHASTTYVAFADDDSWWAPGALAAATDRLDRCDRLALVQARILVGHEERLDPVCAEMARSPLTACRCGAGPSVLGFIACGAVLRRRAFLDVGGFDDTLGFLGEEALLAWDLAAAGFHLAYVADVVAHHHPGSVADRAMPERARRQSRNALLTAWMRRPWPVVARSTVSLARRHPGAAIAAAGRLPAALRKRRRLPLAVERDIRRLEGDTP